MERGRSFETVAAAYDAQRSGYPKALFADIVAYGGLKPGDRALEIGCGSGQATEGFLAEGLDVTGVDPGASLVALAREKFAGATSARFEVSTFETWARGDRVFDLVAAAQSWHWVREDVRFGMAAEALAPGGVLAIFGHTPTWSDELLAALAPAYRAHAPHLSGKPPEAWYLPDGPVNDLIAASGRFERVESRSYSWRRAYSTEAFAGYLGTRSDHLMLAPELRARLLAEVERALPAHIEGDWRTTLYLAQATRGKAGG